MDLNGHDGSESEPQFLTSVEAAALIGVSNSTLEGLRHTNEGPTYLKIGDAKSSKVIYSKAAVLEWMLRTGRLVRTTPTANVCNAQDAAIFLNVSVSTLARLRVHGGGPVFLKIGRRVVYEQSDLIAWLAGRKLSNTGQIV